jgi:integrase
MYRMFMSNFFDWSIKQGYCTFNPAREIKSPRRDKMVPRFFSEDELSLLFEATKEPYRTIFKFLYLTGLRIGELGNLEWGDYKPEQRQIIIRVMEGNKTKREGVIPLNKSAIEIIEGRRGANDSKYIFTGSDGVKLKNSRIYSKFMTAAKIAGITNASPHTFRHTCASHLVIKGVSLYVVRDILRHASIKETEAYAHLSNEATATAIEHLDA